MIQETEEMKRLRKQIENLDVLGEMNTAIGKHRDKLMAISKETRSAEQKLWLVACDNLFSSKFTLDTEEGQVEFADLLVSLYQTIA